MNNQNLLNEIYNSVINIVLNGINESDQEIVCKEYLNIIENRYSNIEIEQKVYNEILQDIIESEKQEWSSMKLETKKSLLINDKTLESIIDISNQGLSDAIERQTSGRLISKAQSDNQIKEMHKILPSVLEFNKEQAKWYITEGSMDFLYASKQTENTSLRLGITSNRND